jgi:hypothetical protein
VTYWIDKGSNVDPSKIQIDIPQIELPPIQFDAPTPR